MVNFQLVKVDVLNSDTFLFAPTSSRIRNMQLV